MTPRPVGGFLELDLPAGDDALRLRHWGLSDATRAHRNARSALAALLGQFPDTTRWWFPAFICHELPEVVPAGRRAYYPLNPDLSPDLAALDAGPRDGDVLLAANFFGRAPQAAFREWLVRHPRIWSVEDCAQALDSGQPAWGDWRLYSPRKLVGVPDGGWLQACSPRALVVPLPVVPAAALDQTLEAAAPLIARYEDAQQQHSALWYPLNQQREAGLIVDAQRMSRLSWAVLGLLDVPTLAARRRDRYALLSRRLAAHSLLPPGEPEFVPLGMPVRVPPERRDAVLARLHGEDIYAAVHWASLPVPAGEFPAEQALADTLITLPCDHRHAVDELERVAAVFLDALRGSI